LRDLHALVVGEAHHLAAHNRRDLLAVPRDQFLAAA